MRFATRQHARPTSSGRSPTRGELRRAAVERLRTRAGLGIRYDFEPVSKVAPLLRDGEAILVLGDDAEEGMRALLRELADRFGATLGDHAEHWAAVYPMTWWAR